MDWSRERKIVALALVSVGMASGCADTEESVAICASECPTTGQAAAEGDSRFPLKRELGSAYVAYEDGGIDVPIMEGELIMRPEAPGCIASPDHPCAATIQRVTVTLGGIVVDGHEFEQPTLSLDAPFAVVDSGSGFGIAEGTNVHTCATVDGVRQHAVREATVRSVIHFDDSRSPVGVSLFAWWPLVLAVPTRACQSEVFQVTLNATSDQVH